MQLNQWLTNYLTSIKTWKNLSNKTILAYQYDLQQFLFFVERRKFASINQTTIENFLFFLSEKSLHPNSIKRKIVSLKNFCTFLIEKNYIEKIDISFSNQTYQLPKKLPKTVSIEDATNFLQIYQTKLSYAKSFYKTVIFTRDLALIDIIISTGIRIHEASNINLADIDWESGKIIIRGKNNKERIVFISSSDTLKNIIAWCELRKQLEPSTNAFFLNKYGSRLSIYGITNIFHKYDHELELSTRVTPHYFRHTFATELLNNGANLRDVQEILGHASITTTQIYTQITTTRKQEVFNKYNYRNLF
jgi:Site-specific recombinase XerD